MTEQNAPVAPYEDPEFVQEQEELREQHEEAAEKRTAKTYDFDNVEDAYADYQEKLQKLAEAQAEVQAAEQALPQLKIDLEQKKIDEAKAKGPQYNDDGVLIGADGENPVSTTNPDPATLRTVH